MQLNNIIEASNVSNENIETLIINSFKGDHRFDCKIESFAKDSSSSHPKKY